MTMSEQPSSLSSTPRQKSWIRRNFWNVIFIIIVVGIPVSCVSDGVSSALQRAKSRQCSAMLKSAEVAIHIYLSLPESKNELIVTEGTGTPVRIWNGHTVQLTASGDNYTFDQILLECGALESAPRLAYGKNAVDYIKKELEPKFSMKHRAYYASNMNIDGMITQAGQDWTPYSRIEVSLTSNETGDPKLTQLPVVFKNGKIDSINFYLDDNKPLRAGRCAYYIIKQVRMRDARRLSQEYNGPQDDTGHQDFQYRGRMIFDSPGASGKTDVYFFLCAFDDNGKMRQAWKQDYDE